MNTKLNLFFKKFKKTKEKTVEELVKETNEELRAAGVLWERTPEEEAAASQMQVVFFPKITTKK